jgi:nicotinamide-nucleotide amidase
MNAIILSVGDELVLGQTVDTNSAWMSQQLAAVGCDIAAHGTVPDDQKAIEAAIRESAGRCDVLIISGGIGPTEDDLSRQALAAVMGEPLELNEAWLTHLRSFFEKLGRQMPETNKIQAMIPRGATMIHNTCGTAAGIRALLPLPAREQCEIFVVPGVPKEMKAMFTRDVLPHITEKSGGAVILSRTLHTFGLGESTVAEKLGELMKRTRNPSVGTTVANGIVSLRVNARFKSLDEAKREIEATTNACRAALGDIIFGADNDTLPSVVATMLLNPAAMDKSQIENDPNSASIQNPQSQIQNRATVSTAESCTGGLLAKMLTDIPGSSDYFKQGWVTYSNRAKTERLGVSENIINVHGAVSEPTVDAMATAARRLAKSDYALAISGIAGPTGGTPTKPVGTVCIALAYADTEAPPRSALSAQTSAVEHRTFTFTGDREMIRDRAAKMALAMLRFHLLGKPLPF